MTRLLSILILLVPTAVACAGDPATRPSIEVRAKGAPITSQPATVNFQLDAGTRAKVESAIKHASTGDISLALRGVIPPAENAGVESVRVYLNNPGAETNTSTNSQQFVGAFAFAPTTSRAPQASSWMPLLR